MAVASAHVVVELVDHDHDHWCRTCLLATGIRSYLAIRTGLGVLLRTGLRCEECGGHDIEVNPDARHC